MTRTPERPDELTLHAAAADGAWNFPPSQPVIVGRAPTCDIHLADPLVSAMHLSIRSDRDGWVVRDLGSRNGTWVGEAPVQDARISPEREVHLRLGGFDGPELRLRCLSASAPAASSAGPHRSVLVIGRDTGCDVVVPHDPLLSRRHAAVETGPAPVLRDLDSFNGTFLDGARVRGTVPLSPGARIGAGSSTFIWDGRTLAPADTERRSALSARHLLVTTRKGARLLDDVTLSVQTGQLVAVIGPSGAGKSTLLGALTGLRPATEGRVTWAGRDLYAEYDQLRFLIGLVPQEDILHRQLTVRRALDFAARLRLPPDTSAAEREQRIRDVLAEVRLAAQIDHRIDVLSGGQRKRTSIALELLTAPRILFLDEPTSGLDPGLDRQVMEGLRALADGGRVVLVVTHSVLALDQCDRVLLLAPGGRVAFYGPPEQLLPFFGVRDHAGVFTALDDPSWVERFAESSVRRAYVERTAVVDVPRPAGEAPPPPRPAPLRQLGTLIRRQLAVVAADRLYLGLLIGMPLVLAAMAHAFPGDSGLSMRAAGGDPAQAQQLIIVLAVGAALMGAALAIREFVAERPIYRREQAVGLSPGAYLASKVLVVGGFVSLQSVVFTLLALLGAPGPDEGRVLPWGRLEIAVATAAIGVVMTIAALGVSAVARSADQTMPALVALIMGQLIFCGGLFPLAGRAGLEQLSLVLPARAGYAAMASTVGVQHGAEPDRLFEPTATQWAMDMGLLAAQGIVVLGLTAWALSWTVARTGRGR